MELLSQIQEELEEQGNNARNSLNNIVSDFSELAKELKLLEKLEQIVRSKITPDIRQEIYEAHQDSHRAPDAHVEEMLGYVNLEYSRLPAHEQTLIRLTNLMDEKDRDWCLDQDYDLKSVVKYKTNDVDNLLYDIAYNIAYDIIKNKA